MARRNMIDVAALPELRRIAEEVRDTRESIVLGNDGEELALVVPLAPQAEPRTRPLSQADYDAVMSAAGSWKGLVDDVDELKAELMAARGSTRPPALNAILRP